MNANIVPAFYNTRITYKTYSYRIIVLQVKKYDRFLTQIDGKCRPKAAVIA